VHSLEEIENLIRSEKDILSEQYKVRRIGIFGSFVRGQAGRRSDVDILVELSEPIGWELIDLKEHLEELLGCRVDLVTLKALKPSLRATILNEVVYT